MTDGQFSSKTLEQRNNDPKPMRVDDSDGRITKGRTRFAVGDPYMYSNATFLFDQRPEFQHGILPENSILVEFRDSVAELPDLPLSAAEWLDNWGARIQWANGGPTSREERIHAHRVLTLIVKSFNGNRLVAVIPMPGGLSLYRYSDGRSHMGMP